MELFPVFYELFQLILYSSAENDESRTTMEPRPETLGYFMEVCAPSQLYPRKTDVPAGDYMATVVTDILLG
jgi:hypothetical protein